MYVNVVREIELRKIVSIALAVFIEMQKAGLDGAINKRLHTLVCFLTRQVELIRNMVNDL